MKIKIYLYAVPNKYLCKFCNTSSNSSQVRKQTISFASANADANDNVIHAKINMSHQPNGREEGDIMIYFSDNIHLNDSNT